MALLVARGAPAAPSRGRGPGAQRGGGRRPCATVRMGEVSRVRQVLTAPALAPGTEQTYAALTDPARRPAVPRQHRQPIPLDTLAHEPAEPVTLTPKAVASALRDARCEMRAAGAHQACLACRLSTSSCCCKISPAQELLAHAATHSATQLARARVPAEGAAAVAMARLTALHKPDGGIRGIATGDAFRRFVARARQAVGNNFRPRHATVPVRTPVAGGH